MQGNDEGVGSPVATPDFYQAGIASNLKRFSCSADLFLIDHSNEHVYIPDDGSIVFAAPVGRTLRAKDLSANHQRPGSDRWIDPGHERILRGTAPRVYTDSAPHNVANAGLTLAGFRGFSGSLLWRHVGNYRLDGLDANIRASGLDVVDLSARKRLNRWIDANLSVDNLSNKPYFETQNYFESRVRPGQPSFRIHGTPGYPLGVTGGLTFHFFGK